MAQEVVLTHQVSPVLPHLCHPGDNLAYGYETIPGQVEAECPDVSGTIQPFTIT